MKQNDEKNNIKYKNEKNQESNEMLSNNNSETYQIVKNEKPKIYEEKKNNNYIDNELKNGKEDMTPRIKRSNSIKLYKRHKFLKEQKKKEKNNNEDLKKGIEDENIIKEKEKPEVSKKGKKVSFLEPNFVTIIDVESYKKFNAENTCKDPFEDPEFLNNISNINKNEQIHENPQENAKAYCSCVCLVF